MGLFHVFHCRCLQLFNLTVSPISPPQTHTNTHAACEFSCWKKKSKNLSDSDSSHGGIPSAAVGAACLSGPRLSRHFSKPCRRRRVNQLPLLYAGEIHCSRAERGQSVQKKKELAGILYEFSSTDLTTGVLPVHLKKLHPKAFFFFKPCYCHSTSFQI